MAIENQFTVRRGNRRAINKLFGDVVWLGLTTDKLDLAELTGIYTKEGIAERVAELVRNYSPKMMGANLVKAVRG